MTTNEVGNYFNQNNNSQVKFVMVLEEDHRIVGLHFISMKLNNFTGQMILEECWQIVEHVE